MQSAKPDRSQFLTIPSVHTAQESVPAPDSFLTGINMKSLILQEQTTLFYAIDFTRNKYSYMESFSTMAFGYTPDVLKNAGPLFLKSLMHHSDLKVYESDILPEIVRLLSNQETSKQGDFSFSCNYRIKTKEGNYVTALQRSVFLLHPVTRNIIAECSFIMDITHFSDDTKMVFTIEQTSKNGNASHENRLLKSVYYPSPQHESLSRRELEILQLIAAGASSKQIAEQLFVSINTVNNHRKNMLSKTGSKNFAQLLHCAIST